MKHYQDYKKQQNKNRGFLWKISSSMSDIGENTGKTSGKYKIIIIFIIGIFIFTPQFFSFAETKEDLQNKIGQKNIDIQKLEEEIISYQNKLNNLAKEKNSLNKTLKELDLNDKKLTANIAITSNKIDKNNLKIENLSFQIYNKENTIKDNINAISSGIRIINEYENKNLWEIIFSKKDFATIWNDVDNIILINKKIKDKIFEFKEIKKDLEYSKEETLQIKNELIILKIKLADEKKIILQNTLEKNKLLKLTKNNEKNYQKFLKERLVKKENFEKELRDYESQLKYVLNPSLLPEAHILSWPLDYIYITQFFGKTEAGKRLYKNSTHNGVDFRAPIGTPVKALSDGVVAGIGDTDLQCPGVSFGRFVLIKYNNGLASTYGHLSLIKVNMGEEVYRGQIVAYSGNTGYSTGPHLHLSIYAKDAVNLKTLPSISCPGHILTQPISPINAYLDPMFYLPSL